MPIGWSLESLSESGTWAMSRTSRRDRKVAKLAYTVFLLGLRNVGLLECRIVLSQLSQRRDQGMCQFVFDTMCLIDLCPSKGDIVKGWRQAVMSQTL
jgi:hypothetical protein